VHPANSNWVAPTAVFDDAAFPGHAYDVRLNVFNNDVGPGTVIVGRGLERAQGQGRSMGSGGGRGGTWDDMKEANKSTLENSINAARRSKETLARATRKVYLDALVQQAGGLDGITLDGDGGGGGGGGGGAYPPPPQQKRWEPDWGGGGAFAAGDRVLYAAKGGGWKLAAVVAVDTSIEPPGYTVHVDGAERETEGSRLAPPPDPNSATNGGGGGGGGGGGVDDMLPRHLLRAGDATSSSPSAAAAAGGHRHATHARAPMPPRPDPRTCEVARHIDGWGSVPAGARDKYKALVVGALDLRSFDDFCNNLKSIEAFQARMEEALARGQPAVGLYTLNPVDDPLVSTLEPEMRYPGFKYCFLKCSSHRYSAADPALAMKPPPGMVDETLVLLELPADKVGELWQLGRQRMIALNEEYQRTQRQAFDKAVVLNVEASAAAGAYEGKGAKPESTASQRIDDLLGGTGVMYQPNQNVRRFESALDQSAAAAAEFEEKASRAEAIAKARRQMLDNVNFANGYERKRQQQQAAMPDAERALTKNYLDRLDPADGSWMHDHARKMRAQHMYDDRGQVEAHWATKCWEDNVVKALKTAGLTDNWGNFLILVIVVFTVSWYRLVSP
jgi:hypothetical protein